MRVTVRAAREPIQSMTAGGSSTALSALLSAVLLGGCQSHPSYEGPTAGQPPQPSSIEGSPVIFLANTSIVDFSDLLPIPPENPVFEGFFENAIPQDVLRDRGTASASILAQADRLESDPEFLTFEAEWVLLFDKPLLLAPGSNRPLTFESNEIRARFGGMAEGKWLRRLTQEGSPEWLPASAGNNIIGDVQGPSLTLQAWDDLFASSECDSYDEATVTVEYFNRVGARVQFREPFGAMRQRIFSEIKPTELVREVLQAYLKHYPDTSAIKIHGINFGVNSPTGAYVNDPARIGPIRSSMRPLGAGFQGLAVAGMRDVVQEILDEEASILDMRSLRIITNFPGCD